MFRNVRAIALHVGVIGSVLATGCGPKATFVPPPEGQQVEGLNAAMERIRAEPLKFLQESLARARALQGFTARFQRQERLGLFAELKPLENISAEYRDAPFSVRFVWLDEDSEYRQCVYVEGRHDDKVVLLPRKGLFGMEPAVVKYPKSWAVLFGRTRNPITDFGPRRLMERTLDRIERAKPHGGVKIRVLAPAEIGQGKEPCFHIELRYPEGDEYACKLQDLYIHTRTHLPVATYLWLPGSPRRTEATLDALYVYGDLNPDATLTDTDFVIATDEPAPGQAPEAVQADADSHEMAVLKTGRSDPEGDQ